jgi:hypothetical protein
MDESSTQVHPYWTQVLDQDCLAFCIWGGCRLSMIIRVARYLGLFVLDAKVILFLNPVQIKHVGIKEREGFRDLTHFPSTLSGTSLRIRHILQVTVRKENNACLTRSPV